MKDDQFLTIAEFAREFKISEWTARKWLREGKIRGQKIGGGKEWRISKNQIDYVRDLKYLEQSQYSQIVKEIPKGFKAILDISDQGQNEAAFIIMNLVGIYDHLLKSLIENIDKILENNNIPPTPSLEEIKAIHNVGIGFYHEAYKTVLKPYLADWAKREGYDNTIDFLNSIIKSTDTERSKKKPTEE